MSSQLTNLVLVMTNSNYLAWQDVITAYLKSQGVWQICVGMDKRLVDVQPGSTSAVILDHAALQSSWDNWNDQAEGYILLWLLPQCLQVVASKTTTFDIWTELHTVFRVQGPSQLYHDFKQATSHHVHLNDPAPDLLEIAQAFGRLTTASVIIPPIVQVMILLNALPCKYESIGQMLLQMETIVTLTFKIVQDGVLTEHACQSNHLGSSSTKASKLSNVKSKGANPKWQPWRGNDKGKQKESSAEPHEQQQKKHSHRNRSRKQQKEKQAKKMQASSVQHSHLALSFAAPLRPFTTVNGRGTITETSTAFIKEVPISLPTKDPQRVLPPQAYTGLQVGPSFYEADNHAWDLLSRMDLPPTPQNLKPLIHHWEDLEDKQEGSSKRVWLTPDRELSPVQEESEISFGMELTPSMEESGQK